MFDKVSQEKFVRFLKEHTIVIAYFWATWCGACRAQNAILEKIQQNFPGQIKIAQIDVDQNHQIALAYQILGTPTLMFFKNGNLVRFKSKKGGRIDRLVGAQDYNRLQSILQFMMKMEIVNKV